jgi:predicted RNase H-like HicB family nuclease
MRNFAALVEQDGDSALGLTFPDLPGCFAAADRWEDVPVKAGEALDLWFEDMPDVAARPLDAIRALPEVEAALAGGAVLMVIPYIPADGAQVRANISLDRGLLRAIDEVAKARKMTRSGFLGSLARREIEGR